MARRQHPRLTCLLTKGNATESRRTCHCRHTGLDVLALSETSNVLEVFGNAGDVLVASASTGGAWVDGGASGGVRTYTLGEATLLVDDAINQAGIVV